MPYTLSIPTTSLSAPSSTKPFTLYHLTITTPLRTTNLPKRYSDFVTLHSTLTTSVGASPPVALPAKSWFARTVANPRLTEERRAGLEAYVKSIEENPDARWRECPEWRLFLGFPAQPSRRNSTGSDIPQRIVMTPAAWLDLHANLKSQLQEARSHLARREAKGTSAGQAHEASASAKRGLVKSNTLILRLEEGLKGLDVGEGELRRRRDLLGRARKEREGLEGLLNAWVVRSPAMGTQNESSAAEGRKTELFGSAAAARSRSPGMGESPGKMPGAFPTGRKGRVLGGPTRETDRTREKDNQEVLMLQKQIMQEQDMDVEEITKTVRRLKELGVVINQEVVEQSQLLDVLDQDADRLGGKINIAKKGIGKIK